MKCLHIRNTAHASERWRLLPKRTRLPSVKWVVGSRRHLYSELGQTHRLVRWKPKRSTSYSLQEQVFHAIYHSTWFDLGMIFWDARNHETYWGHAAWPSCHGYKKYQFVLYKCASIQVKDDDPCNASTGSSQVSAFPKIDFADKNNLLISRFDLCKIPLSTLGRKHRSL